jgi:hypothetical protein
MANPNPDARDELGRSRAAMEAEFWETWKLYVQARKFGSVISDVTSVFTSSAVADAARDLLQAYEAEQRSQTDAELEQHRVEEEQMVKKLSHAMNDEIHRTGR